MWCYSTINEAIFVAAEAQVLILGAGMAGVSAAKVLADANHHDFIIIEATDRIGGRCREKTIGGYTVELGAQWISGTYGKLGGRNNPVLDLALKYNLSYTTADYGVSLVKNATGHDITLQALPRLIELLRVSELTGQLSYDMQVEDDPAVPDFNLRSALRKYDWHGDTLVDSAMDYIETDSFNGHIPETHSLKYVYDWTFHEFEDESFLVTQQGEGGYSKIQKQLLDEAIAGDYSRVHFNSHVTKVEYNNSMVAVSTDDGRLFVGEYAIMTFGLGVLQKKVVEFSPPLPQWKLNSIDEFAMGYYTNFYLKFPSTFWNPNAQFIVYAGPQRGYMTLWQNVDRHLPGSHILMCTSSGENTVWLTELSDSEIQARAMEVLRIMYGPDIPEPDEVHFPRWLNNPRHYATYTYWPTGYPGWQKDLLGQPLDNLYFAGEAYHYMHGYVHGAFLSGEATGLDIVHCLEGQCQQQRSYMPPSKVKQNHKNDLV